MSDIQAIARTVSALAAPGLKPKDLIAAVRKQLWLGWPRVLFQFSIRMP